MVLGMSRRSGFTLVELLATIAVIGLLVALLLPAVQTAREAARRIQCGNNIRQVAIALMAYHSSNAALPRSICNRNMDHPYATSSNGVQSAMLGRPDTWNTMIFPQLELQTLYDQLDYRNRICATSTSAGQVTSNFNLSRTVLQSLICPSDPNGAQPILGNRCSVAIGTTFGHGQWYAGSIGPAFVRNGCPFCPTNAAWGSSPNPSRSNPCCNGNFGSASDPSQLGKDGYTPGFFANNPVLIRFDDCRDGLSNTVLLGETLPHESVHNGIYVTNFATVILSTPINTFASASEIVPDGAHDSAAGVTSEHRVNGIKSRHPGGAYVALADGSVHFLSETMSFPVLWALGTRKLGTLDVAQATIE